MLGIVGSAGAHHTHAMFDQEVSVEMAGGVAGIKGGTHARYPTETPMVNLFLTMLDKAGVPPVESLGDSTGRLELPTI